MIDYTTNVQQNNGLQWVHQDSLTGNLFNPNACAAGGCSGQITLSGPIQPVRQMIPMSWYSKMTELWLEVREENAHLKQRIAELEAERTQE